MLALIVGLGIYWVNANNAKTQTQSESTQTTNENEVVDPTVDWITYSDNGLTFKYPAGYAVNDSAQGVVEVTSYTVDQNGNAVLDCEAQGQSIPTCEVKVSFVLSTKEATFTPQNSDLATEAQQIIDTAIWQ